jgi:SAM-dependent methyltransferase
MRDFSQRSDEHELMDEEDIAFEEFHDCLIGLERINHLTLAYRPTLQWLRPWLRDRQRLLILDVASGGGDMLRKIAKQWPEHTAAEQYCRLVGVDLNPWSKKSAEYWPSSAAIDYQTADVFAFEPAQPIDLIISSLFTHHLTDKQVVEFMQWMDRRAHKGWFINDLHRHPVPYYFIKLATALFSRNRLIRHDAAVSVARAFSVADWQRLVGQAGLEGRVQVKRYFPFRICVACHKEAHC